MQASFLTLLLAIQVSLQSGTNLGEETRRAPRPRRTSSSSCSMTSASSNWRRTRPKTTTRTPPVTPARERHARRAGLARYSLQPGSLVAQVQSHSGRDLDRWYPVSTNRSEIATPASAPLADFNSSTFSRRRCTRRWRTCCAWPATTRRPSASGT